MLPGDRLICAFVSERKVGATFRLWPLHVTIVPWFRLNAATRLVVALDGQRVELGDDDEIAEVSGFADEQRVVVFADGQAYDFALASRGTGASRGLHDGEIEAPMPGKVTAVDVSQGEKVVEGQRLLTLEAMKMEHALTAPFDGTVAELNAKAGAQVSEGQLLAKVEPDAPEGAKAG